MGRLTRDPELRSTKSGKAVAGTRLAVSRRDRDAAPVYVDVVAYDKLAEVCAEHLEKGRQPAVTGRLDYQEWESEHGKRSKHEVIAAEVDFLARPQADGQDESLAVSAHGARSPARGPGPFRVAPSGRSR